MTQLRRVHLKHDSQVLIYRGVFALWEQFPGAASLSKNAGPWTLSVLWGGVIFGFLAFFVEYQLYIYENVVHRAKQRENA